MVLQAVAQTVKRFNPSWPGLFRAQKPQLSHGSERKFLCIMRCFKVVQELCQGNGKEGRRLSQFVFANRNGLQLFQRDSVKVYGSILLFHSQSSLLCVHYTWSAQATNPTHAQRTQSAHCCCCSRKMPFSVHNCTPAFLFNASLFFQLCCCGLLLSDANYLE